MTDTSLFSKRHNRLAHLIQDAGLQGMVFNPGPSLTYLTGLNFHLSERPVVVLFTPEKPPAVVLPELEAGKVKSLSFPVQTFAYGEDPRSWAAVFRQAFQAVGLQQGKVGVEPRTLRVLELRLLEQAAPGVEFTSADRSLADLRNRKDESEIQSMRTAVDIAQRALQATLPSIQAGKTEQEIAGELTIQLLKAGSASPFPFEPIVAAGPNSANPHAVPSSRMLQQGDLLIIDWGAYYNGYISDLTRTFAIGPVEAELANIAEIVKQANAAGCAAARPGVTAASVDEAARNVIAAAGYGEFFIHRTGHGIGMESHEEPYIYAQNDLPLEPGMAFTVEPGIYLPGRGGVRIEDNLVISAAGSLVLSSLPRELIQLGTARG